MDKKELLAKAMEDVLDLTMQFAADNDKDDDALLEIIYKTVKAMRFFASEVRTL